MHCVHLKTSGFLRVLRTRDRIVRSNTWFIHSLLERILKVSNKKPSGISWEALRRHTAGPKRIQTAFTTARPALDSPSARLPIAV